MIKHVWTIVLTCALFMCSNAFSQESYPKYWLEFHTSYQNVDGTGLGNFDVTLPLAQVDIQTRVPVAQLGLGWDNTNLNGFGAKAGFALAPEFAFTLGYSTFENKSFSLSETESGYVAEGMSDYSRQVLNLQVEVSPPLRWIYLAGGMELAFSDLDYRSEVDVTVGGINERFVSAETNRNNFDVGFYGGLGLKILDDMVIPNLAIVTQASLVFSTLSTNLDNGEESTITMDGFRLELGLRYALR
mgnify:CR=1 FL=1